MVNSVLDWLDARSGYRQLFSSLGNTPLPGGASWARTLGPLVLALLLVEALTGVGLAAWYAPSATDAWASVHYINTELELGWLLRGLHHVGGTLLVLVAVLHLVQLVVWAAYRAPRELSWLCLVLALQLLIVTSHTGYLLPNDLRAYWATQVLVGIAGNQPGVGAPAQLVIQGGAQIGNTTLTHLYALHVFLGPLGLVALLGLSWLLGRKAGAPSPPGLTADQAAKATEPWGARQALYDFAAIFAAVAGLFGYVAATGGVHLDAPGDPAADYLARPEWYFLPIFTLRGLFSGSTEFIATSVLPGVATAFLCALPFVHLRLEKQGRPARRILSGAVVFGLLGAAALGGWQAWADSSDSKSKVIDGRALAAAKLADRLARSGVPIEGPLELYKNDPLVWGERVFQRECAGCHEPCSTLKPAEEYQGALCLEGYASRPWLTALLEDPAHKHFYGNTKIDGMDGFEGSVEARDAIVEFMVALAAREPWDPLLAEKGKKAYVAEGCESCHSLDGQGTGDAPDLKGWATADWLKAFVRTPGAYHFYGETNEMDAFGHDVLTNRELAAVVAYVRTLGDRPLKYAQANDVGPTPQQP